MTTESTFNPGDVVRCMLGTNDGKLILGASYKVSWSLRNRVRVVGYNHIVKADRFVSWDADENESKEAIGKAVDVINNPPHYTQHPSGVECITITEAFNFNVGNAIKYLWRAGLKGDAIEDLRKAAWYVQREIERRDKDIKA